MSSNSNKGYKKNDCGHGSTDRTLPSQIIILGGIKKNQAMYKYAVEQKIYILQETENEHWK